ncbi:hypothetical protein AB4517_15410 [Vibrio sp. 10N.222.52.C3]
MLSQTLKKTATTVGQSQVCDESSKMVINKPTCVGLTEAIDL